MLGERPHYGRDSSLGPVLQTQVWSLLYLERYNRPWSVPAGETLKLSYAAECGKKSVITFTWMPPLYQTPWVCHSQASDPPVFREGGLQGSSTNEAAGISLARYKPLFVKPFSWLEAAPSTSYYFSEWKGFTINDAIMLMELPSCLFASPPTKYQSCWRMGKWKHRCSDSERIFAHESEVSREMAGSAQLMTTIGLEITELLFIVIQLFMLMRRVGLAGKSRVFSWDPIKFWPHSGSFNIDSMTSFMLLQPQSIVWAILA